MSKRNNIPYIDIINQFRSACDSSLSISTFDTGTIDFLDANAVNKDYPYIYLRPISSPGVVDKVRSLTFELYSLDVPKLSDESPVKVLSSTEQRIYELLAWFNQGETNIQQVYDVTITDLSPVNEAFQDRVFGWVATIEVATPWQWDYCDYPRNDWPSPTPIPSPTPTPTTSPTATPTPTVSPTGTPIPTATPIGPTATPTPTATVSPTPTGTPFPTPPPSPTPTPTAAPAYFEFLISDTNRTGSLEEVCNTQDIPTTTVYTRWFDEDQRFPDRIVGKEVFSDPTLQTVYTGSAIFDGTTGRIALSASIYAGIELEWYRGTDANIVNTAEYCNYPLVDTLPDVPDTPTRSTLFGQVEDYGDFNLDGFYFFWGTGSSAEDLTNVITASYVNVESQFSASIGGLSVDEVYYYQAAARDTLTDRLWYGDIEEFRPVLPYSREIFLATGSSNWWSFNANGFAGGNKSAFLDWPYDETFNPTSSFYVTEECSNYWSGSGKFVNSYLWTDETISQQYTGSELLGVNVTGGQDTGWFPYKYTTGSSVEYGHLEVTYTGEGYVIQRAIPVEDVNGMEIGYTTANVRQYATADPNYKYRGPRLADSCGYRGPVTGSGLPAGAQSWGWMWSYESIDGLNILSFDNACNEANAINNSPESYDDVGATVHPYFGYMTASAANIEDPQLGLVGQESFLFDQPFYEGTDGDEYKRLVYVGDGTPRTQYTLGWSGSLRPYHEPNELTPIDTIFKLRFSTVSRNPNGLGDDCNIEVIESYPVSPTCD